MKSPKLKIFNKVVIVGVGLIGGSLALAIKKNGLARVVVGIGRSKKTLALAKKIGAIDKSLQGIRDIADADLVILAAPISAIIKLSGIIAKAVKKDCLVTDVGSTKQEIASHLGKVFRHYVGSHPLAGSEKRGVSYARSGIFKDSLCILTPTPRTDPAASRKIKRLWEQLGARVVFMPAAKHDKILSLISHLPHLVAFSLINAVPLDYLKFASTGLRDATRIAASDGEIWADISASNRKNILKAIDNFSENLSRIKSAIKKDDRNALLKAFRSAKKRRDSLQP